MICSWENLLTEISNTIARLDLGANPGKGYVIRLICESLHPLCLFN